MKPPGRPKGTPNRITAEVREVFAKAFHSLQLNEAEPYHLVSWAKKNPKEFYQLASKLIPAELSGTFNGSLTIRWDE